MAQKKILIAGFGGQGVLLAGTILANSFMLAGKNVTWYPCYGAEMRGGTANCSVTVSDKPVGSPVISGDATCAIVMNLPSLDKFEREVKPGGKILVNSSLIERKVERKDVDVYYIPANDIALELGNPKVANMIMLGAYLQTEPTVEVNSVLEAFKKVFGPSKEKFVPLNKEALEKGASSIK